MLADLGMLIHVPLKVCTQFVFDAVKQIYNVSFPATIYIYAVGPCSAKERSKRVKYRHEIRRAYVEIWGFSVERVLRDTSW